MHTRLKIAEYKMAHDNFTITVIRAPLTLTHKMKSFVAVLVLVAVAAADVSHITKGTEADSQIVAQLSEVEPDKYQYTYQTSNGISGQESGALKNVGREDEAISVVGQNSYTAPDGTVVQLTYTADENGYQPKGAHLPVPPPPQEIPEYIIRSLQYIASHPPKPEPVRRI